MLNVITGYICLINWMFNYIDLMIWLGVSWIAHGRAAEPLR